ncbi:MAG TPA: hypothetical protein VIU41_11405 [Geobacteraceae bacterium]
MAKFYDTRDAGDLTRVEAILRHGGIEYAVRSSGLPDGFTEIHVAEEDLAYAFELLEVDSAG